MRRRHPFRAAFRLVAALLVAGGCTPSASPDDSTVRAGLRVLESRHLTLVTDRVARDGDGIDDLPGVFDEAFAEWCRHFGIEPRDHAAWRAYGCLMTDREVFRGARLLPADGTVPDFTNGFCAGHRFWMMDQSNPDYRRHLLLHEGVHAFMLTLRSSATVPTWYAEGIAEYLATHRLDRTVAGRPLFVATPIPQRRTDVEQLGRIEGLESLRAAGRVPLLSDVFALEPRAHGSLAAYAGSWAAVALLANHPAHRAAFTSVERGPLDRDFTVRLGGTPGWDIARATRDFAAFVADLDYGYDFARSAVDWAPGEPLAGRVEIQVAADRGWQNTGRSPAEGQRCSFSAAGRITVGRASRPSPQDQPAPRLESTADGITLRWYRGRPVGRLLVAQWIDRGDGTSPTFHVLAEGGGGTFIAAVDGPVYLKVNESPGDLADNADDFRVVLE